MGSVKKKKKRGLLKAKKLSRSCMPLGKVSVKSNNAELALSTLTLRRK